MKFIFSVVVALLLAGSVFAQARKPAVPDDFTYLGATDSGVSLGVDTKDLTRDKKTDRLEFMLLNYGNDDNYQIIVVSTDCQDHYSAVRFFGKDNGKDRDEPSADKTEHHAEPKTFIKVALDAVCGQRA